MRHMSSQSRDTDGITVRSIVNRGGYAFIVNVIDVRVPLPIQLAENIRVAAATDEQILEMQRVLKPPGLSVGYYYEHEWVKQDSEPDRITDEARPLPRDKWRYFVIAWSGTQDTLIQFRKAANLVPPALLCYSQVLTSGEFGSGDSMGSVVEFVSVPDLHFEIPTAVVSVDSGVVESWKSALEAIKRLPKERHSGDRSGS